MRVGVDARPAYQLGFIAVAIMIFALIVSAVLVHVAPPHTPDGASHVAGITNPVTGSGAEAAAPEDGEPAPAHHEHFEIDHDGIVPTRSIDAGPSTLGVVPTSMTVAATDVETKVAALVRPLETSGPDLAQLSISRT